MSLNLSLRVEDAVGVALAFPGVVDVDVLKAVRGEAALDHRVGRGADLVGVHLAAPDVPRVPAHRRRQGELMLAADDRERRRRRTGRPLHGDFRGRLPGRLERPGQDAGFLVEREPAGQVLGRERERPVAGGRDEEQERPARRGADDARVVNGRLRPRRPGDVGRRLLRRPKASPACPWRPGSGSARPRPSRRGRGRCRRRRRPPRDRSCLAPVRSTESSFGASPP